MCLLDVVFNFFLIFPTSDFRCGTVFTLRARTWCYGAAIGTVAAACVTAAAMLWWLLTRQEERCGSRGARPAHSAHCRSDTQGGIHRPAHDRRTCHILLGPDNE